MESIFVDVNSFAINLVEDHPGYKYIEPIFSSALAGHNLIQVLYVVQYRAYWILTKKWKIDKKIAKIVIENFIKTYSQIEFFGIDRTNLLLSFEYSSTFNHDIYDCYYLVAAVSSKTSSILTTDRDFSELCKKLYEHYSYKLNYQNPVPDDILTQFSAYKM